MAIVGWIARVTPLDSAGQGSGKLSGPSGRTPYLQDNLYRAKFRFQNTNFFRRKKPWNDGRLAGMSNGFSSSGL
jgi:hypothetical protein